MDFAVTALRWMHLAGGLVLVGSFSLLLLAGPAVSPAARRWRRGIFAVAPWIVLAVLAAFAGLLPLQSVSISGRSAAAFDTAEWQRLLANTRYGAVWLVRQGLLLLLLTLLITRAPLAARCGEHRFTALLLALALALLMATVFTGHGAATEPLWLAGAGHALHLLGAGLWTGALPALAWGMWLAARDGDPLFSPFFATLLRRFSALALSCVLVVVVTGLVIGYLQFGAPTTWPGRTDEVFAGLLTVLERSAAPLLSTRFGLLVLAKIGLLAVVVALAVRVRTVWMPRLADPACAPQAVWRGAAGLLRPEIAILALILLCAAQLSVTIPAAHDQFVWPLPFRLSIAATWGQPGVAAWVTGGAALIVGGLVLFGRWFRPAASGPRPAGVRRVGLAALALLAVLGGMGLGGNALSVAAYPDTYRRTDVAYNAVSVLRGAELYAPHCAACHGAGGRGDGELAAKLPQPPANLTEPHTALHTAGDIFWWLTHGKPEGAMPGFAQVMTVEQRWDMVNFLRAFSAGFQARILTPAVVPGQPWLGPPDFDVVTSAGAPLSLKDYRERKAVLLVLYSLPGSAPRMQALAAAYPQLQARQAEVLAIGLPSDRPGLATAAQVWPFPTAIDGAHDTARAYLLYRRSLGNAGLTILDESPAHMEVLIDRFGYARARWLPQEVGAAAGKGWDDPAQLQAQIDLLSREPRIRAAPDDHVH